jgi:HTH-type transcriptional repressor of NAD biosynthesis genes
MIRGLVIGKFMPVHKGHLALIRFAAARCNELIVSMSYTENDLLNFQLRMEWLKEIFAGQPHIKIHIIKDDFDDETLPLPDRTKIWAKRMKKYYPPVNVIFSSENYGDLFAENLGAKHIMFDPDRKNIPVSATLIRTKPCTYWDYIPTSVQPFFLKKICFYGPESTGKSTMAKLMAAQYQTEYVHEAARDILDSNEFSAEDIIRIAVTQDQYIFTKSKTARKILFCDTDVLTTQIYARHYLGFIPEILFELEKKTSYDLYFLMDIDAPWLEDPLRDLGKRRKKMMNIFKAELDKRNISYVLIQGNYNEREQKVMQEVNALLQQF